MPSINVRLLNKRQIHISKGFVIVEGEEYLVREGRILFILLIERTGHIAERIRVIKGLYSKLITLIKRSLKQYVLVML